MDEMTLLRDMHSDVAPPSPKARVAARDRLAKEMRRPRWHRALGFLPRRTAWRVGMAAAAAAALLAIGAIAPVEPDDQADPTAPQPGAEPLGLGSVSAEEVLGRAADQSREDEKEGWPQPRGGQFVYSKEVLEERPVGQDGPVETFTDEDWSSVDGSKADRYSERGVSRDTPPMKSNESSFPPDTYEELKALPDDPEKLMIAARDFGGKPDWDRPMTEDDYDFIFPSVAHLLQAWPIMPKGMRATVFEAIAESPGVEVLDHQVDARGRSGIAVVRETSLPDGSPHVTTIIIDKQTYEYLGMRDILQKQNGDEVDQVSSLVETGIVDRVGDRP